MYFHMTFSFASRLRAYIGVAALAMSPVLTATAQIAPRTDALETRAGLTAALAREERAGRKGRAAAIRARLQEGDFQEGDRVVVFLENMPAPSGRGDATGLIRPDTIPVRARMLQFPQFRYPGVKDLSIAGMLRSELPDAMRAHLSTIYRDPQVRVTSLLQLSITGAVLRPGYADVPPEMRLTDVLTLGGGLAGDANMKKSFIRRGAQIILDGKEFQDALDNGLTVDAAQLRAGDQIFIERKTTTNWLGYAGFAMSVISLVFLLGRGRN
jgi:hypothetical protein